MLKTESVFSIVFLEKNEKNLKSQIFQCKIEGKNKKKIKHDLKNGFKKTGLLSGETLFSKTQKSKIEKSAKKSWIYQCILEKSNKKSDLLV